MATLNTIADEITGALNRPFDWMFQARVKSIFRNEAATMIRQSIDKDGLTDHFKTKYSAAISLVDGTEISCGGNCPLLRTTAKQVNPIRYKTDDPFSWVGNANGTVVYIYTKLTELLYANLTEVYQDKPQRYIYQNGYIYLPIDNFCGVITSSNDYSGTVAGTALIVSTAHGLDDGAIVDLYYPPSLLGTYTITLVDVDSFYVTVSSTITAIRWVKHVDIDCISIEGAFNIGDVFADTTEARLNSDVFTDDTDIPLPEDLIQVIKLKLLQGELSILDNLDKAPDSHLDN